MSCSNWLCARCLSEFDHALGYDVLEGDDALGGRPLLICPDCKEKRNDAH